MVIKSFLDLKVYFLEINVRKISSLFNISFQKYLNAPPPLPHPTK
jgi:hypothetical protein